MTQHAHGTFTVNVSRSHPRPPKASAAFPSTSRSTAISKPPARAKCSQPAIRSQGAAGYVAIEVVTGTLNGKHGSFALQHFATMDRAATKCRSSSFPAPEPVS